MNMQASNCNTWVTLNCSRCGCTAVIPVIELKFVATYGGNNFYRCPHCDCDVVGEVGEDE